MQESALSLLTDDVTTVRRIRLVARPRGERGHYWKSAPRWGEGRDDRWLVFVVGAHNDTHRSGRTDDD